MAPLLSWALLSAFVLACLAIRPDLEVKISGKQHLEVVSRHQPEGAANVTHATRINSTLNQTQAMLEVHSRAQVVTAHRFPTLEERGNNTESMQDQRCQKKPTCDEGGSDQRGAEEPTCNGGGCKQQRATKPRCSPFNKASNSIRTCDQTNSQSPRCEGDLAVSDEAAWAEDVGEAEVRKIACDQSSSSKPVCDTGHCDQAQSSGADCKGGWCDQEDATDGPACSHHCMNSGAENPRCDGDCVDNVDTLFKESCPKGGCYQQRAGVDGRKTASCEGGFCDQCQSEGSVCEGGHCDQSESTKAKCPKGDCDQSESKQASCTGGHCDRDDAEHGDECETCYHEDEGSGENDCKDHHLVAKSTESQAVRPYALGGSHRRDRAGRVDIDIDIDID